jgi:hypothetical protein
MIRKGSTPVFLRCIAILQQVRRREEEAGFDPSVAPNIWNREQHHGRVRGFPSSQGLPPGFRAAVFKVVSDLWYPAALCAER